MNAPQIRLHRLPAVALLASFALFAAASPHTAAAHMSENLQDTGTGPQGPGLGNCRKVPHELKPYSVLPPDGSLYFKIDPDAKNPAYLNSIPSPIKGIKAYAVEEDAPFTLHTNVQEFWAAVEPKLKEKISKDKGYRAIIGQGVEIPQGECELTIRNKRVRWQIAEFEIDGAGATKPGGGRVIEEREIPAEGGDGALVMGKGFPVPNDPHYFHITARHYYEWEIRSPDGKVVFGNRADMVWDSIVMKVIDNTPPRSVYFMPSVLFATSGDEIAAYNGIADLLGAPWPRNGEEIVMIVPDNAQHAFEQLVGVRHDSRKVQAKIYAETYVSRVTPTPPGRTHMPVEKSFQEYCDGEGNPPEGLGKFVWAGPIDLREDLGLTPQTVPQPGSNPEVLNLHVWRIPIAALEKKLHEALLARHGPELEAPPERKLRFLDHHFASGSMFEYRDPAWEPVHIPSGDLQYTAIDDPAPRSLGKLDFLRITAAACDAAGNWSLPVERTLLDWNAAGDVASGGEIPLSGAQRVAHHASFLPLVVFDDDRPNPMIVVTAQGRDGEVRTTRFTIPNGDLAARDREESGASDEIAPYANRDPEWIFDWKGESPAMKWLEKNDPKRFKEYKAALEILENTRVVFEVAAYDNVNKYVSMKGPAGAYCKFGIWTPQVKPKDSPGIQFERPVTWRIHDPTVPDEEMLFEDRATKIYIYPDHIYRAVDQKRMAPSADGRSGYGVEVLVNDASPFNDPAKNGGMTANWRKIGLWFNLLPSESVGVDRLGNEETVDGKRKPAGGEGDGGGR